MKKIYANYCALVSLTVSDDATDDEINQAVANAYAERGFDFNNFDDGEWDAVTVK